jgi:hypothetical protein
MGNNFVHCISLTDASTKLGHYQGLRILKMELLTFGYVKLNCYSDTVTKHLSCISYRSVFCYMCST